MSISQRPVYHLPFVLIFSVLSEGKNNCSNWSKVKDIANITFLNFIKELMIRFYILPERKLLKDYWSVKLNSTFLMPAKKPSEEVVAFEQVSKLFKFRKNLRFF